MTENSVRKFYVAYSFRQNGMPAVGACDVTTPNKMSTANLIDFQEKIAARIGIPANDLAITFFAELEE